MGRETKSGFGCEDLLKGELKGSRSQANEGSRESLEDTGADGPQDR